MTQGKFVHAIPASYPGNFFLITSDQRINYTDQKVERFVQLIQLYQLNEDGTARIYALSEQDVEKISNCVDLIKKETRPATEEEMEDY